MRKSHDNDRIYSVAIHSFPFSNISLSNICENDLCPTLFFRKRMYEIRDSRPSFFNPITGIHSTFAG